jgi:type II secretory pathway component PulF
MQIFSFSRGSKLSPGRKARFFSEASGLLEAGLRLEDVLLLLGEGNRKHARELTTRLLARVREGCSLAGAMAESKAFSGLDILACEVGEHSARMPEVFHNLGSYYAGRNALRQSMGKAASYPLMVMSMSLVALLIMSVWVIPTFAGYYAQSGAELPRLTLWLMRLAETMPQALLYLSFAVAGLIAGDRILRRSEKYLDARDRFISRLPFIGRLVRDAALERFCAMLSLMMGSGLCLSRSLDLLALRDPSIRIRQISSGILSRLSEGSSLASALHSCAVAEPMLCHLVAMGEETGRLPLAFRRAAQRYSERLERRSALMGSWFEPVLVIVSGGLVALMLAGLYLPMFDMGKFFA